MSNENENESKRIVFVSPPPSNGIGTAGFVLALVAVFIGWIPFFGWIAWVLGLILSCIGLGKEPRGLAIAGVVLSLINLILLIVVIGAIFGGMAILLDRMPDFMQ